MTLSATRTFKHSGDLGDIIYSLPAVKALGGGVLFLDTAGGQSEPHVHRQTVRGRTRFNAASYQTIRPLLMEQPYLEDVRVWQGESVQYNLDSFRASFNNTHQNLAYQHLSAFGLSEELANQPWLSLRSAPIKLSKPIIINRSPRHHSKYHWWMINIDRLALEAIFLGHPKEHEIFEYTFDCKVDYHATQDALEIARILKGSQLLVANQSFIMSLAIGLGTAFMQERFDYAPNCVFPRPNAQYF